MTTNISEIRWAFALELTAASRSGDVKQEAAIKKGGCTKDIHWNDEYFGQEKNDVS